jgi:hypothetical protein
MVTHAMVWPSTTKISMVGRGFDHAALWCRITYTCVFFVFFENRHLSVSHWVKPMSPKISLMVSFQTFADCFRPYPWNQKTCQVSCHVTCPNHVEIGVQDMPFDNKIPDSTWYLTCHLTCILTCLYMTSVMLLTRILSCLSWQLPCFWHVFWHDSWHLFCHLDIRFRCF